MVIQSPPAWGWDQLQHAAHEVGSAKPEEYWGDRATDDSAPTVCQIGVHDLKDALAFGIADFEANRSDVIFLCIIYPIIGLVLARAASGYGMLPLLFPLASGFALVGPFFAVGLNEMSRRREHGGDARWMDAFGALRAPSIGGIAFLGLMLIALFLLWLVVAQSIYVITLGPKPPVSAAGFISDVFTTPAGWAMIIMGVGAGFLFALTVLATSVVSFPLLLDRNASIGTAVATSIRAVTANPGPMAVWGIIVAGALVVGSLPCFVGLVVVLPILGHATWHLYRRVVTH